MRKLPIGIQDFAKLRSDDYLFIDKTELVYSLVSDGGHYFLSRPRRFGKSLLLSTLKYFFEGRRDLFEGLAIHSLEKDWTPRPIFHIDLSPENYLRPADLEARLNKYLSVWEREYGEDPSEISLSARFEGVVSRAASKAGRRVVILVDEYDKPMLSALGNGVLQEEFRGILKAFYGVLKSQDGNIRLSFLTGVTKFSKISIFSDLNNLNDISRDRQYAGICGITQAELEGVLKPYLNRFTEENASSYSNALKKFKAMYDGYRFTSAEVGVYNPFSVFSALLKSECRGYWFETGTPSYLVKLIKDNNVILEDITTHPMPVERLEGPDGDVISVLFQSGYLTISDFFENGECRLDFPNDEVREGFFKYLFPHFAPSGSTGVFEIGRFVSDLNSGNAASFLKRLQSFFADFDYSAQESPEAHYRNVLFVLCRLLGLQVDAEYQTSDGRIDLLIRTSSYVYIMEFKLDSSAEEAMSQIRRKEYSLPWACDDRQIINIGVNFSSASRRMEAWIIDDGNEAAPQPVPQVTPQPTPQVAAFLKVLAEGPLAVSGIMERLSLSDRKNFRKNYLESAIANGWVAAVYPDTPNHPRQAYRLTETGHALLIPVFDY